MHVCLTSQFSFPFPGKLRERGTPVSAGVAGYGMVLLYDAGLDNGVGIWDGGTGERDEGKGKRGWGGG